VDNFGIKYIGEDTLQHLYDSLRAEAYDIVKDRAGNGYVDLSMPTYVMKQLTGYSHPTPIKPQHCPFAPNPITYSKNNQAPNPTNNSPLLDDASKKHIQQVVGSFLYYA
jgi:hypothetical protein